MSSILQINPTPLASNPSAAPVSPELLARECLQWEMSTPLGSLYLVASAKGLRSILWRASEISFAPHLNAAGWPGPQPDARCQILALAQEQLTQYFAGQRREFSIPLDAQVVAPTSPSDFRLAVWKSLGEIPYGETRSYTDIARQVGREKATRAVGTANGNNPWCIVVPCHRVIASGGGLGGYNGGIELKRNLLALEQRHSQH